VQLTFSSLQAWDCVCKPISDNGHPEKTELHYHEGYSRYTSVCSGFSAFIWTGKIRPMEPNLGLSHGQRTRQCALQWCWAGSEFCTETLHFSDPIQSSTWNQDSSNSERLGTLMAYFLVASGWLITFMYQTTQSSPSKNPVIIRL